MAARKNINLLPQEEFAATTTGRVLTWLLSTFRIIVIVTELIVMAAFLSRFWLDARNTDLNDAIAQKQLIISSYSKFEKEFRNLQARLSIFNEIASQDKPAGEVLAAVASSLPADIVLTGVSIKKEGVEAVGLSGFERSISQFIANLAGTGKFVSVSFGNAVSDTVDKNLLVFMVKMKLEKGGK